MDYSGLGIFGRNFEYMDTTPYRCAHAQKLTTGTLDLTKPQEFESVVTLKICINPEGDVMECSLIKRASRGTSKDCVEKQCDNILNSKFTSNAKANERECGIMIIEGVVSFSNE